MPHLRSLTHANAAAAVVVLATAGAAASSSSDFDPEVSCTSEDAMSIWTSMPACQPRETIVEVPRPFDPDLFQVY